MIGVTLIGYPRHSLAATVSMLRNRQVIHEAAALQAWKQAKRGDPCGTLPLAHYAHKETAELLRQAAADIEQEGRLW